MDGETSNPGNNTPMAIDILMGRDFHMELELEEGSWEIAS